MNKNGIIEAIDKESDFSKLIEDLLVRMGLVNVFRISDNLIEATQKTALKNQKIFFLVTLSELNGKVPAIDERIKNITSKYDQLYIVTSNAKLSNYFQDWLSSENQNTVIEYWSKKDVIDNINQYYEDFWSHNDTFLKPYEINFIDSVRVDKHLKSLLKLDDKYDKLLEIFIEPKLYIYKEDAESETLTKSRINKDKIIKSGSYVLSGEAGTGKSTLLKEIGKELYTFIALWQRFIQSLSVLGLVSEIYIWIWVVRKMLLKPFKKLLTYNLKACSPEHQKVELLS